MKCASCGSRARKGSKRDALPLCESCGGRLSEISLKPANPNAGLQAFWRELHPARRFTAPGYVR